MAKFTVDTHLFRELGELLVGRDSTALIEMVKNAYDADATEVTVFGERLNDPDRGRIIVTDNGTGMTSEVFSEGFLRVASRLKRAGDQRSQRFGRRYTGAKGIGRLAAHKLARRLEVTSVPWTEAPSARRELVQAVIDWDKVEALQTLDDIDCSDAITVKTEASSRSKPGTTIVLTRLRRAWTAEERARFFAEVQSFDAPEFLKQELPNSVLREPVLFSVPRIREPISESGGDKFRVRLEGDLASGEEYWEVVAQTARWIIEIRASRDGLVRYGVAPTKKTASENKDAECFTATVPHPTPTIGPFFDARILVRVGALRTRDQRVWASRSSGIRVYLEGFRVLPYGESKDDWLSIDADYTRRRRTLDLLQDWSGDRALPTVERVDRDAPLVFLPHNNYVGAVFLTQADSTSLRALVNREGFVPEAGFDSVVKVVRTGVDLCTRVRAAADFVERKNRRENRSGDAPTLLPESEGSMGEGRASPQHLRESIGCAAELVRKAGALLSAGDVGGAKRMVDDASPYLGTVQHAAEEVIGEHALMRVVASVGTQMAAFVHEVNTLLGSARTIEAAMGDVLSEGSLSRSHRKKLTATLTAVADLRRGLERQASYLTDILTPDARRRRSRQRIAERFDAAGSLVAQQAERRGIRIINEIDPTMRTPPMFAAEITAVFANLLTNAIKAAGGGGVVRATARPDSEGGVRVRLENTGVAVELSHAERWFRPYESTTVDVSPVLGQGMGLGLPITRSVLTDYGAEIRFVKPSSKYATAVEIAFPA